jgi:cell division septation protein DedD
VADITHDAAEDGFHEINLSGKQVIALFMIATTVVVFIFLCGVLVGRNLRDGDGAMTTFAASASDTETRTAQVPLSDPPTPAETADELTYHGRLQGENAEPPPQAEPPQPMVEPQPQPTPPPVQAPAEAPPADVPEEGRPGRFIVQVFASKSGQAAASVVRQLAAKGYPAYLVRPAANAAAPMYRVQVGRYDDKKEAETVSRRIEKEEQFKPWISSR